MGVSIRAVERGDFDHWRRLWRAYLAFYETEVSDAMYNTAFRRLLTEDENEFHGQVAVRDGRPVGLVHYLFHRHGWREERVVYLQDLYVDSEVRGSGAGRALIEAVYAAADAAGCPTVYWLTQDFNQTARQLYDRIGAVTPFIKYQRVAS